MFCCFHWFVSVFFILTLFSLIGEFRIFVSVVVLVIFRMGRPGSEDLAQPQAESP